MNQDEKSLNESLHNEVEVVNASLVFSAKEKEKLLKVLSFSGIHNMKKAKAVLKMKYKEPMTLESTGRAKLLHFLDHSLALAVKYKLSDEQLVMLMRSKLGGTLLYIIKDMQEVREAPTNLIIEVIFDLVKGFHDLFPKLRKIKQSSSPQNIKSLLGQVNYLLEMYKAQGKSYTDTYLNKLRVIAFKKLWPLDKEEIEDIPWNDLQVKMISQEDKFNLKLDKNQEFKPFLGKPVKDKNRIIKWAKEIKNDLPASTDDYNDALALLRHEFFNGTEVNKIKILLSVAVKIARRKNLGSKQLWSLLQKVPMRGPIHTLFKGLSNVNAGLPKAFRSLMKDGVVELIQGLAKPPKFSEGVNIMIQDVADKVKKIFNDLDEKAISSIVFEEIVSLLPQTFRKVIGNYSKVPHQSIKGVKSYFYKIQNKLIPYFEVAYPATKTLVELEEESEAKTTPKERDEIRKMKKEAKQGLLEKFVKETKTVEGSGSDKDNGEEENKMESKSSIEHKETTQKELDNYDYADNNQDEESIKKKTKESEKDNFDEDQVEQKEEEDMDYKTLNYDQTTNVNSYRQAGRQHHDQIEEDPFHNAEPEFPHLGDDQGKSVTRIEIQKKQTIVKKSPQEHKATIMNSYRGSRKYHHGDLEEDPYHNAEPESLNEHGEPVTQDEAIENGVFDEEQKVEKIPDNQRNTQVKGYRRFQKHQLNDVEDDLYHNAKPESSKEDVEQYKTPTKENGEAVESIEMGNRYSDKNENEMSEERPRNHHFTKVKAYRQFKKYQPREMEQMEEDPYHNAEQEFKWPKGPVIRLPIKIESNQQSGKHHPEQMEEDLYHNAEKESNGPKGLNKKIDLRTWTKMSKRVSIKNPNCHYIYLIF